MAISFSRPDPSSPAAVADANFPTSRRGFDQQQVRDFLRMVAAELARSQERERYLEQELRSRRQEPQAVALPVELDDETVARLLGEETTRIIQAARESSAATRAKADEAADRVLRDAREESLRLREDIETEVARRRKDSENEAAVELESAKQQGREMVEEARAYREKALSELARRRDLARQQIDHLVHARDRLVQAFERARLAAADVVSELVPLGEFDEYVNLAPTTGPVPVMVPASRLADASSISDDALRLRAEPDESDTAAATDIEDDEIDSEPSADGSAATATNETPGSAASIHDTNDNRDDTRVSASVTVESGERADADDVEPAAADAAELADPATEVTDAGDTDGTVETVVAAEPVDDADPVETVADPADNVETVGRDATVLQFPAGRVVPFEADPDDTLPDDIPADDTLAEDIPAEDAPADEPPAVESADDGVAAPQADAAARPSDDEIDDDDVTASDVDSLFARLRASQDDVTTAIAVPGAVAADAAMFEHRDETLTPLIVASGRKLKRVLADEQNAALDMLRQKDPVTTLDLLVGDEVTHLGHYFDAVSSELMVAATAGAAAFGSTEVEGSVLTAVGEALRDDLIRPLRDRLAERIGDGDGDNEAISRSARSIYREWKTKHIDDHLDDLLRIAYNRGALAALPAGTPVQWAADPSVGACSECEDNSLQGDVPAGDPFPTGHVTAPAHSGCRCLIVPASQ